MYTRAARSVACILLITAGASADYIGVTTAIKVDANTEFLCNEGNGEFVPGPLTVCNIFAGFSKPKDRLLLMGNADITASNGLYFQHPFNFTPVSPPCAAVPAFPDLICDSFVTIGLKCGPPPPDADGTAVTPDWDSGEFNFNGHVVGAWFNADPLNGQGDAGNYPNLQVLFLQLSVPRGESITGTISVFARINDEVVAFDNQAVDCFAVVHCKSPEECDDGDPCTAGNCVDKVCVNTPINCDDGNHCTDDSCDPETGCMHTDSDCDDDNACTDDSCDPETGCMHTLLDCDDQDPCTDDSCHPETGCVHTDLLCDDEDACTDDSCDPETGCVNTDLDCDDQDACTDDACDPESGCVNENIEQTLVIKQSVSRPEPDCEVPVNSNSNGVLPMLLVGTDGFDVHEVDKGSLDLHLCGEGASGVEPIADNITYKDFNHPNGLPVGCPGCQCDDDVGPDGIDDLWMKFDVNEVVAALGLTLGAYTLELTGQTMSGAPFCSRDCIVLIPPGFDLNNATAQSNVQGTLLEVSPMDLNFDLDGFADFTRSYVEGTTITLTAPITSGGRRFLRWSINGETQEFGIRTIEVTISEHTTIKAFYRRPGRILPEFPTEGSGDQD